MSEELQGGLRRDPVSGLVQPWYTHPALDEIATWDVRGKKVLEWGGGQSTLWWECRGAEVTAVEDDPEWIKWIADHCLRAGVIQVAPETAHCVGEFEPDIAVVDSFDRLACLKAALALPRPLTLIVDNWRQEGVFVSDEAEALMAPHEREGKFYVQPGQEHLARPWCTAIWRLT